MGDKKRGFGISTMTALHASLIEYYSVVQLQFPQLPQAIADQKVHLSKSTWL